MKKYIILMSAALLLNSFNACSERDLELFSPSSDLITSLSNETELQKMLNGSYLNISSANALGANLFVFGDILGDKIYNTSSRALFIQSYEYNYNGLQNQFTFYRSMYDAIMSSNIVINNTSVKDSENVKQIKGQAKILRGLAYFILVNYYSPSPTSGVNQEYGVPLVLGDYDSTIQPARATVAENYNQIIKDLTEGMNETQDPANKVILGPTAAKLILSRVYLTRRAAGDAQLALQYATEVADAAPEGAFKSGGVYSQTDYSNYFKATDDTVYEGHPETLWELDMNFFSNQITGIGSNGCLPVYYSPGDNTRRSLLATRNLYESFGSNLDIRRGAINTGLFSNQALTPEAMNGNGYWINKYPKFTSEGNFFRNIRVLRYSEAFLNRIEALRLTGQQALALTELNAFAASRQGTTYTGTNLLSDILTERSKEFYGEGQRFLDLKRYNLPVVRTSNCTTCELQASDHRFVLPVSQDAKNNNANLKQYPGYTN